MGTVEKRGKNSWRICTMVKTNGKWEPVRMTLRMDPEVPESIQRREAERELRKLEKRLAGTLDTDITLRDWSEIWITKHLAPDASPVTVSSYRYLLDSRILPRLGDEMLTDLTPALLTDWLYSLRKDKRKTTRLPEDQLSRPRTKAETAALVPASKAAGPISPKTLQLYYGCVKSMLAAAVRLGYLEHNPMDRVQRPKRRKHQAPLMSEADAVYLLRLILTEAQQPLKLAVLLAMLCGLRLGEVCALRYLDIDWDAGTIAVHAALKYTPETGAFIAEPKTEAGTRVITLPRTLLPILRDAMWRDVAEAQDEPEKWRGNNQRWIVHSRHGVRVNKDTPSKWFRAFADAHGYQGITFHDLRHAHASLLVASQIDIAAIAARMGHSDPAITLSVYTHAMPARDLTAAAALDQLLVAAQPPAAPAVEPAPQEDPASADPQEDPAPVS